MEASASKEPGAFILRPDQGTAVRFWGIGSPLGALEYSELA
jgi:hypothetical protein